MNTRPRRTVYLIVLMALCVTIGAVAAIIHENVQDHRDCVQVMTWLHRPIDTC